MSRHNPKSDDSHTNQLMVRVMGANGQEILVPHLALEEKLVPALLEQAKNHPDILAHILENVWDRLPAHQLVSAGKRLFETDPLRARGVRIWASILIRTQQLDMAEQVILGHLSSTKPDIEADQADLLALLGGLYLRQEREALGRDYIWRGLEVNPNSDSALEFYCRQPDGSLSSECLLKVASLPNAWRARTLYWGQLLEKGDVEKVQEDAEQVLQQTPRPVPQELLLQLSGDLGNWGHLVELIRICTPYYEPGTHDIRMGSNLLKANLDLGQIDSAQTLLDQLYGYDREEWKDTLDFWDLEVAKLKLETEDPAEHLVLEVRQASSPLWRVDLPSFQQIFPTQKKQLRLGCIGGSAALGMGGRTEYQLSEIRGILSRSIPVLFAEQLQLCTEADTEVLYLTANGTFLLSGQPLDTEELAHFARQRDEPFDYLLATHLEASAEPWHLHVRLIRTIDKQIISEQSYPVVPRPPGALTTLIAKVLCQICRDLEIKLSQPPTQYQELAGDDLIAHMIHLEQLLALQLDFSRKRQSKEPHVHGHRHILEGMLEFCLRRPKNLVARLILLESVVLVKQLRPAVGQQFFQPCLELNKSHPISDMQGAKLVQELSK